MIRRNGKHPEEDKARQAIAISDEWVQARRI